MRVLLGIDPRRSRVDALDYAISLHGMLNAVGVELTVACTASEEVAHLSGNGIDTLTLPESGERAAALFDAKGRWSVMHSYGTSVRPIMTEAATALSVPHVVTIDEQDVTKIAGFRDSVRAVIGLTEEVSWNARNAATSIRERIYTIEQPVRQRGGSVDARGDLRVAVVVSTSREADHASAVLVQFMERVLETRHGNWSVELITLNSTARKSKSIERLLEMSLQDGAPSVTVRGLRRDEDAWDTVVSSVISIAPRHLATDALAAGKLAILVSSKGTFALPPLSSAQRYLTGGPNNAISGSELYNVCARYLGDSDYRDRFTQSTSGLIQSQVDMNALGRRLYSVYQAVIHEHLSRVTTTSTSAFGIEMVDGQSRVTYTGKTSGLEFAFYVLRDDERLRTLWYSKQHYVTIQKAEAGTATSVRCFIRRDGEAIGEEVVDVSRVKR